MSKKVCPKCGKEVEDAFAVCPYCGQQLQEEVSDTNGVTEAENNVEIEEKEVVGETATAQMDAKEEAPVVEQKAEKKKMSKNKMIIAGMIAVVIIIAAGFGYKSYADKKAHEAYVNEYNEYVELVKSVQINMLDDAAQAEALSNSLSKIWSNAIWEKDDAETDAYTKENGVFVADFNTALSNYFKSEEAIDITLGIKVGQNTVDDDMKKLKNPPAGLEDHHDVIKEMYEAYTDFVNFATNPSGSLTTFRQKAATLDSDFITAYDRVDNLDFEKIK